MRHFFRLFVSLCILTVVLPEKAGAWGLLGHRIIGQIAEQHLSKKARKEVMAILGTETMAMTSNWADYIKSDSAYDYLYNWHFINLPENRTREQVMAYLQADTATNAYTKINFLAEQLKNRNLAGDKKLLYLRVLIHIVGDIHQPLHVGRLNDLGGNRIKVLWFRDTVNLHQVWDERLIGMQELSYTEYSHVLDVASEQQVRNLQSAQVADWIYDSYTIANKIYGDVKPLQKLGYAYNYNYLPVLNKQLLEGGIHLAALLNQVFG